MLVGDRDGVLVIPRHLAAEIAEQGYEQEQLEAYVSTKIHAGEPLRGNPPAEETIAEFKALPRALPSGLGQPARDCLHLGTGLWFGHNRAHRIITYETARDELAEGLTSAGRPKPITPIPETSPAPKTASG